MKTKILLAVFLVFSLITTNTNAQGLFGYDGDINRLFSIRTGPFSTSLVGTDPGTGIPSEIEYGDGVLYLSDTLDNTNLHLVSPLDGQLLTTVSMLFPVGGDVITALEFVDNQLYAGFTTEGGGDTGLAIVDTQTGDVSLVGGFSGIGRPLGGLAYDGSLLYGVTAGGSSAELYTFDLATGIATFQNSIVDAAGAPIGLTALEFGNDGILYGLPNMQSPLAGNLLAIDVSTGLYTALGDTGIGTMNSLTTIPEPTGISILFAFAAGMISCRRRN